MVLRIPILLVPEMRHAGSVEFRKRETGHSRSQRTDAAQVPGIREGGDDRQPER